MNRIKTNILSVVAAIFLVGCSDDPDSIADATTTVRIVAEWTCPDSYIPKVDRDISDFRVIVNKIGGGEIMDTLYRDVAGQLKLKKGKYEVILKHSFEDKIYDDYPGHPEHHYHIYYQAVGVAAINVNGEKNLDLYVECLPYAKWNTCTCKN